MTEKQADATADFVQKYWFVGLVLVGLAGFAFGTGEEMSSLQSGITAHEVEIKAIVAAEQQQGLTLQSIQIELAQEAQQLADIKAATTHQ